MPECIFSQKFHLHFTQILQLIGRLPFFSPVQNDNCGNHGLSLDDVSAFSLLAQTFFKRISKEFLRLCRSKCKGRASVHFLFAWNGYAPMDVI